MATTTAEIPLDKRWVDDRVERDAGPPPLPGGALLLPNDTLPLITKPTKPKVADAAHLAQDPNVADGSEMAHIIKQSKLNLEQPTAPPATTQPMVAAGNSSDNGTEAHTTTTIGSTSTTSTTTTTPTTTTTTTTPAPTKPLDQNETSTNSTIPVPTGPSTLDNIKEKVSTILMVINSLSKVQFAYLVIAVTVLLVSLLFMVACCRGGMHMAPIRSSEVDCEREVRKVVGFRTQVLILLFVFYFLYVGMEVTYAGLCMTFSVTFLGWSKSRGSLLTSVFWGAFAAARGLAILLARCLSPPVMLIADLVIVMFALIGLVLAAETSEAVMWSCTALLGIGMASIFPTGISWAERYMHVTGKATAVFVVGSALGEMMMPALAGFLFEAKGPMWLIYVMLAASIFSIVIYIVMQNLATNMGERYKRLRHLPVHYSENGDMEEDCFMETNSLTPTDTTYSDDWSIQRRKRVTFNLESSRSHYSNGDLGTSHTDRPSILKTKLEPAKEG